MALTTVDQGLLGTYAQYTGFKNRIINGSMQVAQRGNLILSANGTTFGGPDRFFLTVGGFSTVSVIALQAGAVFPGSAYSYQIGNLLTTGGPGTVTVTQRIESANSYDLNSQPVTITLQVLQQTGASVNAQLVLRKPSAKDNFASVSLVANSGLLPVPDSTITTLTFTTTLGASDASNGLQVELYFPTMPATTNKQIYTAMWQLEAGSTATSFDYRPYGTELALCQRYYQVIGNSQITGSPAVSSVVFFVAAFSPQMRTAPTSASTANSIVFYQSSGNASFTGGGVGAINSSSTSGAEFQVASYSGLTSGSWGSYRSSGTGQIAFTAEL
jgi:hypothetical protein